MPMMNIHDALDQFLVQLDADGRSTHTIAQYKRHVLAFERWLVAEKREVEIATITPAVVAAFFVSPAARCCAQDPTTAKRPTSLNAMRTSLRCFFAFCSDLCGLAHNPARRLRRARCSPLTPRCLEKDALQSLVEVLAGASCEVEQRDAALFHLMLATGLRVSSALSITIEDIDFSANSIEVRSVKGEQPLVVFLGPKVKEHLERFVATRKTGPLFVGPSGRPIDRRHAHRRLNLWLRRAGIERSYSPHALRHTFATNVYEATHDLALVSSALGHKSLQSTTIYARVPVAALRNAVAAY